MSFKYNILYQFLMFKRQYLNVLVQILIYIYQFLNDRALFCAIVLLCRASFLLLININQFSSVGVCIYAHGSL
jgi:fatty-acid desaturase